MNEKDDTHETEYREEAMDAERKFKDYLANKGERK